MAANNTEMHSLAMCLLQLYQSGCVIHNVSHSGITGTNNLRDLRHSIVIYLFCDTSLLASEVSLQSGKCNLLISVSKMADITRNH